MVVVPPRRVERFDAGDSPEQRGRELVVRLAAPGSRGCRRGYRKASALNLDRQGGRQPATVRRWIRAAHAGVMGADGL